MNDRFAAQLRQHLLETADVRPADGQLGRVLAGVAATAQRHPAAARLTWIPGRIGPIPSTFIRYGLIAAALALAAMSGAGRPVESLDPAPSSKAPGPPSTVSTAAE